MPQSWIRVVEIAAQVSTPLGVVGLLLALGTLAYWIYARSQLRRLESVPEAERARLVDTMATRYKVDATGWSEDQKYQVVRQEMRDRFRIRLVAMVLSAVVFLLAFAIAVLRQERVPEPARDALLIGLSYETLKVVGTVLPDRSNGGRSVFRIRFKAGEVSDLTAAGVLVGASQTPAALLEERAQVSGVAERMRPEVVTNADAQNVSVTLLKFHRDTQEYVECGDPLAPQKSKGSRLWLIDACKLCGCP